MKPSVVVATTESEWEPVSLAEAKKQLRIDADITHEDAHITALITAIRLEFERQCNRCFTQQDFKAKYDKWPSNRTFHLARPHTIGIVGVSFTNNQGTVVELTPDDYVVDVDSFPAILRVREAFGDPQMDRDTPYPIVIEYAAGFEDASKVPQNIKEAMLLAISTNFELRVNIIAGAAPIAVPGRSRVLLNHERYVNL
jgi:uncharacterized phiE125 gp8 family phage protein